MATVKFLCDGGGLVDRFGIFNDKLNNELLLLLLSSLFLLCLRVTVLDFLQAVMEGENDDPFASHLDVDNAGRSRLEC